LARILLLQMGSKTLSKRNEHTIILPGAARLWPVVCADDPREREAAWNSTLDTKNQGLLLGGGKDKTSPG
jgi:hypothetical protein